MPRHPIFIGKKHLECSLFGCKQPGQATTAWGAAHPLRIVALVARVNHLRSLVPVDGRADEIGLFPLGVVLLPTERVPLHIFEPRYRELIGECLTGEQEFGFILRGDDETHSVGTRAVVTEVLNRFADGRLDVVVEGRDRFEIDEATEGRSFETALVEPYEDVPDPPSPETAARALVLFGRLVELTGSDVDVPDSSSEQFSFGLAARFEFSPPLKQELLESRSERARLERLCEMLEKATEIVARQHEIAEIASTNGHAKPGEP